MNKLFAVTVVAFVTFVLADFADAEVNTARFAKEGAPDVWVTSYLGGAADSGSTAILQDVINAFVRDGWVVVDSEMTGKDIDHSTRCLVLVRSLNVTYIRLECGPASSYGNGIYVRSEFNSMTSPNPAKEGKSVPAVIRRMYDTYNLLKAKGLTEFYAR